MKAQNHHSSETRYTYYGPRITYTYRFNDETCAGSKASWVGQGDTGPLKDLAYKFKYHYDNNKPITVFVNPQEVCEAIADRSIHWSTLLSNGVICLIALIIGGGIVYLLIRLPKS